MQTCKYCDVLGYGFSGKVYQQFKRFAYSEKSTFDLRQSALRLAQGLEPAEMVAELRHSQ